MQMGRESLEIRREVRKVQKKCGKLTGLFFLLGKDRRQRERSFTLPASCLLDPLERMREEQGFHPRATDHWMTLVASCCWQARCPMCGEAKAISETCGPVTQVAPGEALLHGGQVAV